MAETGKGKKKAAENRKRVKKAAENRKRTPYNRPSAMYEAKLVNTQHPMINMRKDRARHPWTLENVPQIQTSVCWI